MKRVELHAFYHNLQKLLLACLLTWFARGLVLFSWNIEEYLLLLLSLIPGCNDTSRAGNILAVTSLTWASYSPLFSMPFYTLHRETASSTQNPTLIGIANDFR